MANPSADLGRLSNAQPSSLDAPVADDDLEFLNQFDLENLVDDTGGNAQQGMPTTGGVTSEDIPQDDLPQEAVQAAAPSEPTPMPQGAAPSEQEVGALKDEEEKEALDDLDVAQFVEEWDQLPEQKVDLDGPSLGALSESLSDTIRENFARLQYGFSSGGKDAVDVLKKTLGEENVSVNANGEVLWRRSKDQPFSPVDSDQFEMFHDVITDNIRPLLETAMGMATSGLASGFVQAGKGLLSMAGRGLLAGGAEGALTSGASSMAAKGVGVETDLASDMAMGAVTSGAVGGAGSGIKGGFNKLTGFVQGFINSADSAIDDVKRVKFVQDSLQDLSEKLRIAPVRGKKGQFKPMTPKQMEKARKGVRSDEEVWLNISEKNTGLIDMKFENIKNGIGELWTALAKEKPDEKFIPKNLMSKMEEVLGLGDDAGSSALVYRQKNGKLAPIWKPRLKTVTEKVKQADGSYKTVKRQEAYFEGDQANLIAPFGLTEKEGKQVIQGLVDKYNGLLDTQGLNPQQLKNLYEQVRDTAGLPVDIKDSALAEKILKSKGQSKGMFSSLRDSLSLDSKEIMDANLSDSYKKGDVYKRFEDFTNNIDQIRVVSKMLGDNRINSSLVSKELFKPGQTHYLEAFQSLFPKNSKTFKEIKGAWIDKLMQDSMYKKGPLESAWNPNEVLNRINSLSPKQKAMTFTKDELNRLKYLGKTQESISPTNLVDGPSYKTNKLKALYITLFARNRVLPTTLADSFSSLFKGKSDFDTILKSKERLYSWGENFTPDAKSNWKEAVDIWADRALGMGALNLGRPAAAGARQVWRDTPAPPEMEGGSSRWELESLNQGFVGNPFDE